MTDAPRRLSLADQALANALAFVALPVIEDERMSMVLGELPGLLPAASTQIPAMARLVHAGVSIMAIAPRRQSMSADWCGALMELRAALAEFFFWRGGMAIDALRAATAEQGAA